MRETHESYATIQGDQDGANVLAHKTTTRRKKILDGVPQITWCPAARATNTCVQNRFLELAKGFEPPTL
jgi:hypothetical protein